MGVNTLLQPLGVLLKKIFLKIYIEKGVCLTKAVLIFCCLRSIKLNPSSCDSSIELMQSISSELGKSDSSITGILLFVGVAGASLVLPYFYRYVWPKNPNPPVGVTLPTQRENEVENPPAGETLPTQKENDEVENPPIDDLSVDDPDVIYSTPPSSPMDEFINDDINRVIIKYRDLLSLDQRILFDESINAIRSGLSFNTEKMRLLAHMDGLAEFNNTIEFVLDTLQYWANF